MGVSVVRGGHGEDVAQTNAQTGPGQLEAPRLPPLTLGYMFCPLFAQHKPFSRTQP